ncbi:MAG: GspE/PulE family protein [Candidatus Omnitrophica bacterium]|nr:GspE/PulE family protein [Candidatus Omnitrophota bacterium]MBU1923818.1 GspE/PulE family protein [Candidatus Omnitrophota bacterium]
MYSLKEDIIGVLLKSGHITNGQFEHALNIQKAKGLPLRRIFLDEEIITEEALSSLFLGRLYMPTLCLGKFKFDIEIINLFPERIARLYNAIPLARTGNRFIVSTSDPLNIFALDDLDTFGKGNMVIVFNSEDEVTRAIESQYGKENKDSQSMPNESALTHSLDANSKLKLYKASEIELPNVFQDSQAPIAELVDIVLANALNRSVSDIHIDPEFDCLRIRYRVDGLLQDVLRVPKINQNSILARLKIISDLDITESRIPQDGKFKVRAGNREVEFRVSSLPTTFGQKFVLHALDKSKFGIGLDELGFSEVSIAILKAAAGRSSGMILVSGPADSNKSNTLYYVLNHLNTSEKNIITIEDPVEYQIDGVSQVQVNPDVDLDFACGLRSILRQSPDVVMIGQIRDSETADIAVKAALSGQLILSTMQTGDAISSIARLIEMGVEPFLLASGLIMLCAQRLARKICFKCRKPIDIPKDFLEKKCFSGKAKLYTAQGCEYCNHTGFFGRVAVSETILIDDAIRDIIICRKPMDEIRKYAVKHLGIKTLRDNAYLKVKEGLISLDEAIRITTEE